MDACNYIRNPRPCPEGATSNLTGGVHPLFNARHVRYNGGYGATRRKGTTMIRVLILDDGLVQREGIARVVPFYSRFWRIVV
jgi:hypothetical protein